MLKRIRKAIATWQWRRAGKGCHACYSNSHRSGTCSGTLYWIPEHGHARIPCEHWRPPDWWERQLCKFAVEKAKAQKIARRRGLLK